MLHRFHDNNIVVFEWEISSTINFLNSLLKALKLMKFCGTPSYTIRVTIVARYRRIQKSGHRHCPMSSDNYTDWERKTKTTSIFAGKLKGSESFTKKTHMNETVTTHYANGTACSIKPC